MTYLRELEQAVLAIFENTQFDFRTLDGLYKDLYNPAHPEHKDLGSDLNWLLMKLASEGVIRNPVLADPKYDGWWRLASKKLTWREQVIKFRAYFSHDYKSLREDRR